MCKYEVVIGLEVHVQLATKSKLFCSCSTKFGKAPNTNVCEICCGMPGSLPAPNHKAIDLGMLAGIATHCKINMNSVFSRKNYFYPDLPAGYQISQFDLPLCKDGFLKINMGHLSKKIGIIRIHLENDAGKNIHLPSENLSCVDFNRAGTPLAEIVSAPDLRSPEEAVAYLKCLHELVTYLGVSDGNMEEGNFRCDANISLRPYGANQLGTRTELKNLNSFRNVQKALEYEIIRQGDLLDNGENIVQETRLYNPDKNITISMRGKEEAQDYRYFPDPDLLPIAITKERLIKLRKTFPKLPEIRKKLFKKMTGLPEAEIDILVHNARLADYFEAASREANPHKVASFILGPIIKECNNKNIAPDPANWKMPPRKLADVVRLLDENKINVKIANNIISDLLDSDDDINEYIEKHGLIQISDSSLLERTVQEVINEFPKEFEEYKKGKNKLLSFFMGQIMRKTRGKANPSLVAELLNKRLQ